jgi:hypothetical protein
VKGNSERRATTPADIGNVTPLLHLFYLTIDHPQQALEAQGLTMATMQDDILVRVGFQRLFGGLLTYGEYRRQSYINSEVSTT